MNEDRMEAQLPFKQSSKSSGRNISFEHKTPFMDYKEGDDTFTSPSSILRMRIEKAEVP